MYGIVFSLVSSLSFALPNEKFPRIVHIAGSFLFGIMSSAGNYIVFEEIAEPTFHPVRFLLLVIFSFCSWSVLFSAALNAFHYIASHINFQNSSDQRHRCLVVWMLVFLICMAGYAPYLLTYYPGVIEYDSYTQLCQVFGGAYSNHHPWLHTMIIKAIYHIGTAVLHSENRAIALYSLWSMSVLSAAFATGISYLYGKGVKNCWLLLGTVLYAFTPIKTIYSITMWKDIPFAAAVLFYMILLCKLADNLKQNKNNVLYWILFVPLSFLVCFFRSNGLYVFLLMIPIMLFYFRKQMKSVLVGIAVVIFLIAVYKGPVFRHFNVSDPDRIESLSIPAQQIAAVIRYGGEIEDGDFKMLEEIIDVSKVSGAYGGSVGCSDAIKDLVRETDNQQFIGAHGSEFFTIWLRMGIHNPYYYFKAYADETRGFWYHEPTPAVGLWATYVYEGVNGLGIVRECKMPDSAAQIIPNVLTWYAAHFKKYYSCALYIYILLFCFIESLRQKNEKWFIIVPLLGIWLTLLIATPMWSDMRYIYAIYTALPFSLSIILLAGGGEGVITVEEKEGHEK